MPISDLEKVQVEFLLLLRRKPDLIEIGRFYQTILTQEIWPTQKALARGLNVPTANVNRALALANLPSEILEKFDDGRNITVHALRTITKAMKVLGKDSVCMNASNIHSSSRLSVEDKLFILQGIRRSEHDAPVISVRCGRNNRYLRIDGPNLELLIPYIPVLENLIRKLMSKRGS